MSVAKMKDGKRWYAFIRYKDWAGKTRQHKKEGFQRKADAQQYERETSVFNNTLYFALDEHTGHNILYALHENLAPAPENATILLRYGLFFPLLRPNKIVSCLYTPPFLRLLRI